jgi:uncharacterized protein with beta-barrel porin domain
VVEAGTLALAGGGSLGNGGIIRVMSGAILDASSRVDGALTLAGGQTLQGGGAVNGSLVATLGATVSPGTNSIGTLTISNSLTLQAGSTNWFELNKSAATNDQVCVGGTVNYGGTLTVTNLGGTLAAGDTFQIYSAANYNSSAFAVLHLPSLGVGLGWNTTNLTVNGSLSVIATAVPQFSAITPASDGNFSFSGTGAAGVTYELDAATNLELPMLWFFVTNTVADQNGLFQLSDQSATNFPQRFYRIMSNQ